MLLPGLRILLDREMFAARRINSVSLPQGGEPRLLGGRNSHGRNNNYPGGCRCTLRYRTGGSDSAPPYASKVTRLNQTSAPPEIGSASLNNSCLTEGLAASAAMVLLYRLQAGQV
jgi:hypothetical protein